MSNRAVFRDATITRQGVALQVLPFASVTVYYAGTLDPILETMYTSDAGVGTLTNPFTSDADGNYAIYLDAADQVKLKIEHPSSGTLIIDDVQVRNPDTQYVTLNAPELITNKKFSLQDGSAANPAIYFESETGHNSGFYKSANSELAASIDGVQKFIINSSGILVPAITLSGFPTANYILQTAGSGALSALDATTANRVLAGGSPPSMRQIVGADIAVGAAIPLARLNPASANNGDVITRVAGDWTYATPSAGVMVQIGTQTLASPAATIDFTAIPAIYTSLLLIFAGRTVKPATTAVDMAMQFGNASFDTGNNYDFGRHYISTNVVGGSSASATGRMTIGSVQGATGAANRLSPIIIEFPFYAKSGFQREYISLCSARMTTTANDTTVMQCGGGWRSTAVLERIRLIAQSSENLDTGSQATLYGIV